MGTEVLRPQDLLVERFHVSPPPFYRRRNFPASGNLTALVVNRRPSNNKRTSPKPVKKKLDETKKVTHGRAAGEARRRDDRSMPQVTILRRGESLDSLIPPATNCKSQKPRPADDLAVLGAGRIGTDSPLMIPKQIHLSSPPFADVYAGSACSLSPSPRSLPLPSFFNKKQQDEIKVSPLDDPATRDLRRLLRLE